MRLISINLLNIHNILNILHVARLDLGSQYLPSRKE